MLLLSFFSLGNPQYFKAMHLSRRADRNLASHHYLCPSEVICGTPSIWFYTENYGFKRFVGGIVRLPEKCSASKHSSDHIVFGVGKKILTWLTDYENNPSSLLVHYFWSGNWGGLGAVLVQRALKWKHGTVRALDLAVIWWTFIWCVLVDTLLCTPWQFWFRMPDKLHCTFIFLFFLPAVALCWHVIVVNEASKSGTDAVPMS